MTPQEIHHRIATLADELREMHTLISDGHAADDDGFVKPGDPDLADALRAIDHAVTVLSRLAYRISRDEGAQ